MNTKVAILNYNMGNIYSIKNAVESLGFQADIVSTAEEIHQASKLIIPGVGAFGEASNWLHEQGLIKPIRQFAEEGGSLLGICLGMQLLFESGEENGYHEGLALVKGNIIKFPDTESYCVPQMQWNIVKQQHNKSDLYNDIPTSEYFYFLHGYFSSAVQEDAITATASYCNIEYCCSIQYKNIYGVQYHPEKSGVSGLSMLRNFCSIL